MAKLSQQDKTFLSRAGEFGTLSELLKRKLDARITIGNTKAMDIQVMYPDGNWKSIEVKTSRSKRFVTNYWQKYYDTTKVHPDYWVIVHIDESDISHYYILTHAELGETQTKLNRCPPEACRNGVDNVRLKDIIQFNNMWDKIVERK